MEKKLPILVTGAAGFIGSHLVEALLQRGNRAFGVDDLSLGKIRHLDGVISNPDFYFHQKDLLDWSLEDDRILEEFLGGDDLWEIWHLAANSDIPAGMTSIQVDLAKTFQTTIASLGISQKYRARRFLFASSSAVFGEHFHPISEDTGPLLPLSYYGAMKLASEAAISAAAEDFLEQVYVFRFPNVVGPRATHGVIYDFVRKLIKYPHELEVLGDGSQQKPYLHVEELVEAMFFVADKLSERRNWVNIGQIGFGTRVSDIARLVVSEMGGVAKIRNTGGDRGWRGDVPKFDFRVEKLIQLGWKPRLTSDQTIERAVKEIVSEMTQVRGLS